MKHNFYMILILLMSYLAIQCTGGAHDAEQSHNHDAHEQGSTEHSGEIVMTPEIMKEVGIQVEPVTLRKLEQVKIYPGKIVARPDGEAFVGSLIGGRVVAISVGIGDYVVGGASLCEIESPEIGAAQSTYIRAAAQYNVAQKDLVRHQKLMTEQIGSEKELLAKQAEAQAAKAELDAAERAIYSIGFSKSEAEALLNNQPASGRLILKSPIAGTVTDWSIRLGQRVEPASNLFHVVDLSRLWAQISLYEKDLAHIRIGQSAKIIPQSFTGSASEGKVVRIGREVKGDTRTIDCFVEIENPEKVLIPNLFVTCSVHTGEDNDELLAVPEAAVVMDQHSDYSVFVEHEPQSFIVREIEIGRSSNGWMEVTSGLNTGERVVFKGAFFIKSEQAKNSFGHGHAH
ncbi:efflux RND transporter periplasmic adaptor subunit [candidate division KSB1 bacterium]|nr:efflux RND transporter periplasmic adaptor subunit [candidate division KSB1 bacterium]